MTKNYAFAWDGSHPATNFVNTLDERLSSAPLERLSGYDALVEFVRQAGWIDDSVTKKLVRHTSTSAGEQVLTSARQLREALFRVLYATVAKRESRAEDIAQVEFAIHQAHLARHLMADESRYVWAYREPHSPQRPLWELAIVAEHLLLSENLQRVKKCAAHDCSVLFLDDSRAGGRRWCSMSACGNRDKVQRFRAAGKNKA